MTEKKKPFITYEQQVEKLYKDFKWGEIDYNSEAYKRMLLYVKTYSYMFIKYGYIQNLLEYNSTNKNLLRFFASKPEYVIYFIDISRRVADTILPYVQTIETRLTTALIHVIGKNNPYVIDGFIRKEYTIDFFKSILVTQNHNHIEEWIVSINDELSKHLSSVVWAKSEDLFRPQFYVENSQDNNNSSNKTKLINKYYIYTWPKLLFFKAALNLYNGLKPEYKKEINDEIFKNFINESLENKVGYHWLLSKISSFRNLLAHGDSIAFINRKFIFYKNTNKKIEDNFNYLCSMVYNINSDEYMKFMLHTINKLAFSTSTDNKLVKKIKQTILDKFDEDKHVLEKLNEGEIEYFKQLIIKVFVN